MSEFDDDSFDRAEFDGMLSSRGRRRRYGGSYYNTYSSYDSYENDGWWNGWRWGRQAKEKSKTALESDLWDQRRGRELAKEWDKAAQKAEEKTADGKPVKHDEYAATDCYKALFSAIPRVSEDIDEERPDVAIRAKWLEDLMETPDYKALHASTCYDNMVSEMAAVSISKAWNAYYAEVQKNAAAGKEGGIGDEMAKMRGIRDALKGAGEIADAVDDAREGCGMGGYGEGPGSSYDKKKFKQVFQKIKDNDVLAQIFAKAGRMWRFAAGAQRRKVSHGVDEMIGVEMGGNIANLLPQEFAMLANGIEAIELEGLRRLADRQMLVRKRTGAERVGKGPIITVVDESGSMSGDPIITAKAVALTMARIAKSQNRWAGFVGFSGGCEGTRLAMPPDQWDSDKLMKWLEHFYSGGTCLDVPVQQLPNVYWREFEAAGLPAGKTDVVMITDAQLSAPSEYVKSFKKWKEAHQVRCYGIIIGGDQPGDMTKLCEQTWSIDKISVAEEAIQAVFSV